MGYTKIETPADTEYCEDCEQDFPIAEMSKKHRWFPELWCNECRDSYDPTPQEQWEVTSPVDLSVVMDEHGRIYS